MHLVYYIYAVLPHLRRNLHLVHKGFNVLYGVVGGRVQFMDAVGTSLRKGDAGFAFPAGLHVRSRIGAVYHLCKDTGRGSLTNATGSAEKVCMCKLPPLYGIGERARNVILADKCFKGVRPVLPCRNDILTHSTQRYKLFEIFGIQQKEAGSSI